jgi:hypothetical protein
MPISMDVTDGKNRIGSGSVRFFPWIPRLTSSGKKFIDIASGILVN